MRRSAIKRSSKPMKRAGLASSPHKDMTESGKTFHVKPRKPLNPMGKKGNEWYIVRQRLKKHFQKAGITTCEFNFQGCSNDASGGFAHCKKRRKLEAGELWHVAVACLSCHRILDERMTHEEMHAAVHAAIGKRGLIGHPNALQQIPQQANADR